MRTTGRERRAALIFLVCGFFAFNSYAFSFPSSLPIYLLFPIPSSVPTGFFQCFPPAETVFTGKLIAGKPFAEKTFTGKDFAPDTFTQRTFMRNFFAGQDCPRKIILQEAGGLSGENRGYMSEGFPADTLKKVPSGRKLRFERGRLVLLPAGEAGPTVEKNEAAKETAAKSNVVEAEDRQAREKETGKKETGERRTGEKEGEVSGAKDRKFGERKSEEKETGERKFEEKGTGVGKALEKDITGDRKAPEQKNRNGRGTGKRVAGEAGSAPEEGLVLFKPELVLKTKYEMSTESGTSRFTVRNSRVGLLGDIASYMSYRFLVELSGEGKFEVLDLYANIRPLKGLSVTFGQCSLPIYNSYTTSPSKLMFANRPFIGKYFSKSRDIGINVKYTLKQTGFPIAVEAGVYNGEGINNPKWTKTPSLGGRILFGDMEGFRATAKVYKSKQNEEENFFFWGADIRYDAGRIKIEAEVMDRYNKCDKRDLFASYVQGAYSFPLVRKVIREIQPALRWDAMGYDFLEKGFGVNRLTLGVNFVFDMKPFNSVFRIDYEQYFRRDNFEEFAEAKEMDESKLTLELLIYF